MLAEIVADLTAQNDAARVSVCHPRTTNHPHASAVGPTQCARPRFVTSCASPAPCVAPWITCDARGRWSRVCQPLLRGGLSPWVGRTPRPMSGCACACAVGPLLAQLRQLSKPRLRVSAAHSLVEQQIRHFLAALRAPAAAAAAASARPDPASPPHAAPGAAAASTGASLDALVTSTREREVLQRVASVPSLACEAAGGPGGALHRSASQAGLRRPSTSASGSGGSSRPGTARPNTARSSGSGSAAEVVEPVKVRLWGGAGCVCVGSGGTACRGVRWYFVAGLPWCALV
jgi:hypothetical protein